MDIECKPTWNFHPLQCAVNWLRDPFATPEYHLMFPVVGITIDRWRACA